MKYLVDLLEKESKVYSDYLGLAVEKKKALLENDIDALDEITESEKSLSSKVLALEAARAEFLRENGYPVNSHIDDLLANAGDHRELLREKADALKEVLVECKKASDGNMQLLKQSSNYINHMIKVFSNTLQGHKEAVTYSKGAQKLESGQIADMQG